MVWKVEVLSLSRRKGSVMVQRMAFLLTSKDDVRRTAVEIVNWLRSVDDGVAQIVMQEGLMSPDMVDELSNVLKCLSVGPEAFLIDADIRKKDLVTSVKKW